MYERVCDNERKWEKNGQVENKRFIVEDEAEEGCSQNISVVEVGPLDSPRWAGRA